MKRLWTSPLPGTGTRLNGVFACGVGAVLLAAATLPPSGDASVVSLSVEPDSGRAQVVIGVSGDVQVRDFVLHDPERVVIDIGGATLGVRGRGYDRVARGGVLDVRYAQNQPTVVRVVLTLAGPRKYDVQRDGKQIRVRVDGGGAFAAWRIGTRPAAAVASAPAPAAVTSLPIIPKPESVHAPASTPANPPPAVSAPAPAAASAVTVPAASEPARVSVTTTVEQAVKSQAAPVPAERATRAPGTGSPLGLGLSRAEYNPGSGFQQQQVRPQQPRITIAWERADIRDVLAAFAAFSGRTIIPARAVGDITVTAEIIDKPWDVAMRAILNANGLDAIQDENGIIIVNTIEALASTPRLDPVITRTVRLNYTSARAVAEVLRSRLSRDCSSIQSAAAGGGAAGATPAGPMNCPVRGTVTADTLTNSVSITDVPTTMNDLIEYAQSLDIRQPQVNIKAKIILVDRTQLEGLGLKYDLGTFGHNFNELAPRLDSAGNPQEANVFTLGGNAVAAIANASANVPSAALKIVYSTALGGYDFTTFLEALQQVSLLDVQAEPSVTTLNYRRATLKAGTQVPIRTIEQGTGGNAQGNFPTVTVSFRQTGVVLEVTPFITANRQILMKIHAENSDVQYIAGDVGAVFPTQSIDNDLLVGDGETAVMGGLTQTSVRVSKSGIPLLVDLPMIGRLFGVTNREETKRDLLILITPHIVDESDMAMEPRRQP